MFFIENIIENQFYESLKQKYENFRYKFILINESNWYNNNILSKLDILITFTIKFNIINALNINSNNNNNNNNNNQMNSNDIFIKHNNIKPDCIIITFILPNNNENNNESQLNEWIKSKTLGNYDLIIVSNEKQYEFLNIINENIGFPVNCFIGCPKSILFNHKNNEIKNKNSNIINYIKTKIKYLNFLNNNYNLLTKDFMEILYEKLQLKNESFIENSKENFNKNLSQKLLFINNNNNNQIIKQTKDISIYTNNPQTVCIGIRTMISNIILLEILIESLINQYIQSINKQYINLNIYIIETEDSINSQLKYQLLINELNNKFSIIKIFLLIDYWKPFRTNKNYYYGYDSTDLLIEYILLQNNNYIINKNMYENNLINHKNNENSGSFESFENIENDENCKCDYIMITNGDNMYNNAWFDIISNIIINNPLIELIGWDFITHHPRFVINHNNNNNNNNRRNTKNEREKLTQQLITIKLERKYVDLGSILIKTMVYETAKVKFLPQGLFTDDIFARDYITLMKLLEYIDENNIHLIHQALMFHQ